MIIGVPPPALSGDSVDKFLRTGLASLASPRSLTAATRTYTSAIDDLARQAGLAARPSPADHPTKPTGEHQT